MKDPAARRAYRSRVGPAWSISNACLAGPWGRCASGTPTGPAPMECYSCGECLADVVTHMAKDRRYCLDCVRSLSEEGNSTLGCRKRKGFAPLAPRTVSGHPTKRQVCPEPLGVRAGCHLPKPPISSPVRQVTPTASDMAIDCLDVVDVAVPWIPEITVS